MEKIYFVDSENVGDNWVSLLNNALETDQILVFYTQKSPHMNYKNIVLLKQSAKDVTFIECCEGYNALDFQLCTQLGYLVCKDSNSEFVIVSNDTGYDAVVKYWLQSGINIRRIQGKACSLENEEAVPAVLETEEPVSSDNTPQEINSESEIIDERAKEILYIIGKENLQQLHESLKQIYGDEKGKVYYNAFKQESEYTNFIQKHIVLSLEEKYRLYCSIVFETSDQKLTMPENFPEIVKEAWSKKKNLNSLRASILSKYKKNVAPAYYSIIKAHVKILDSIK